MSLASRSTCSGFRREHRAGNPDIRGRRRDVPRVTAHAVLHQRRQTAVTAAVGLALCCLAGCQLPPAGQKQDEGLSPVLVRLRETYADLRHGPFVSLADFESPGQAKLFRVAGPEDDEYDRRHP